MDTNPLEARTHTHTHSQSLIIVGQHTLIFSPEIGDNLSLLKHEAAEEIVSSSNHLVIKVKLI